MEKEKGREEIIKGFSRHLDNRNIRSKSPYLADLKEFFRWCDQEVKDFLSLSEEEAEAWLLSLLERDKPLARGTVNGKLYRLKSFYTFLMKKSLIGQHPFYYLKPLRTGRQLPRDILRPEEMERLLSSFPEMRPSDVMIKCLMELLYGCALRISEAESIRLEDMDLIRRTLVIIDHKNRKRRKVPLTEASARLVHRYCEKYREGLLSVSALQAGFLFPQGRTTTLRCRLNNRLKTHCQRLGIKTLTSHSFRHSAATHLLRNGAGIRQVQAYLGHESIESTQRYTHVEKDDLKNVVAHCHPREVLTRE
ncbi:MAG: tyrosine-type recombinase/integrase [Spirochaetales bacterium]|nr:tyrosine-type recombinase/integrase [Spirochaetales bacterium]